MLSVEEGVTAVLSDTMGEFRGKLCRVYNREIEF